MPTGQIEQFNCEGCGKSYRWKAELAGKRVKCKCGQTMTIPQPPAVEVESDDPFGDALSAMADAEQSGAVSADADLPRCPSCSSAMSYGSTVCMQCGFNVNTGKTKRAAAMGVGGADGGGFSLAPSAAVPASTGPMNMLAYAGARRSHVIKGGKQVDNSIGDPIKDMAIPIGLFALGVILTFCEARYGRGITSIGTAMAFTGFMVVFNLVLVFAAIMIAVKVLDLGLGPIGPALLKIAAVSVLPGAAAGMLFHIVGEGGFFIVWFVSLFLTYGMFMGLLGLDMKETSICSGIIWVMRTWVGYALVFAIIGGLRAASGGSGGSATGRTTARVSSGGLSMMSTPAAPLQAPATGPKVTPAVLDGRSITALSNPGAMEARAWVASGSEAKPREIDRFNDHESSKDVVEGLYSYGALRVVISKVKADGDYQRARQFVITLPAAKGNRSGLVGWGRYMVKQLGGTSQPDVGQKYLLVDLDGTPTVEEGDTFRDQDEGKY